MEEGSIRGSSDGIEKSSGKDCWKSMITILSMSCELMNLAVEIIGESRLSTLQIFC